MSKKNIHLKESGLNAFLLLHAEKVGLAVAMLLAILFVLWAPDSKKSGTQKSPADLNQQITAARSHIQSLNQNTWEQQLLPGRQPPNDYPERVRQQQKSTAIRTAKLRLSNLKIEELTQIMRGKSKFIKH